MAEGGGLLNRYTVNPVSWVRIPSPPPPFPYFLRKTRDCGFPTYKLAHKQMATGRSRNRRSGTCGACSPAIAVRPVSKLHSLSAANPVSRLGRWFRRFCGKVRASRKPTGRAVKCGGCDWAGHRDALPEPALVASVFKGLGRDALETGGGVCRCSRQAPCRVISLPISHTAARMVGRAGERMSRCHRVFGWSGSHWNCRPIWGLFSASAQGRPLAPGPGWGGLR